MSYECQVFGNSLRILKLPRYRIFTFPQFDLYLTISDATVHNNNESHAFKAFHS